MEYEWDENKNRSNVEKHSIGFDDAIKMFSGPILEKVDHRQDYGEERMIALGLLADNVTVVVYTVRENKRRIISARRANRDERAAYHKKYATQN